MERATQPDLGDSMDFFINLGLKPVKIDSNQRMISGNFIG